MLKEWVDSIMLVMEKYGGKGVYYVHPLEEKLLEGFSDKEINMLAFLRGLYRTGLATEHLDEDDVVISNFKIYPTEKQLDVPPPFLKPETDRSS